MGDAEPAPDPEVQALRNELAEVRQALAGLQEAFSKAEETDKEPAEPTRSVDPLRRRSNETVLDVQSDGLSKRKPPTADPEPEPEPLNERQLRRQFEKATLELLTGNRSEP